MLLSAAGGLVALFTTGSERPAPSRDPAPAPRAPAPPATADADATSEPSQLPAPGSAARTAPPKPRLAVPDVPSAVVARTFDEVTRVLESRRAAFVEQCLQAGGGAPTTLQFEFVLDADGKEVGRTLHEEHRDGQPDTAQCVGALLEKLSVSPIGSTVAVSGTLRL